jgi:tetratricopeptide (TPR) repeat protein
LAQGRLAYAAGDWDRTASLARQQLKMAPEDPEALRLVARTAARQNRDQAAIATYSRLELKRMGPEDYFLLGRSLSRTGQDDLALKSLEAARAGDPDRIEMLDELARVYFRRDRPAAAAEIAETLARQTGWEPRAQFMLGTFRAEVNDPAGAARALLRGLELDSDASSAAPQPAGPLRTLLVRCLLQTGQPAQAARIIETIPGYSSDPESSWLLSRCFLQQKELDSAAAALERAGAYRIEHAVEPEPAPYVGAAKCGSCHRSIYQSVLASRHAATFSRPRSPQAYSLPEEQPLRDPGDPRVSHAFQSGRDGIRVETRTGNQVFRAVAQYAFGSPDHYVTFVGPDDRGRARMLRISSYHSPRGSGLDLTSGLEPHPTDPAQFLGNLLVPLDGQRRCLMCHTTNARAIELNVGPEATDHSIGCEACHGPGANHLVAVDSQFPDPAIISFGLAKAATVNQVCALCHGVAHLEAVTGDVNDPAWLRFQSTTMYRSRCYTESSGQLHCATCHNPHANATNANAAYETKCQSCHDSGRTRCPVNPSSGCIECHMPRSWMPSTHSFKSDHNIRVHRPHAAAR